ncbi:MAG: 50S ribosomal protein L21 [Alphaproteobacteria bacterium]|nr:50S ribosomal protein L21 [Alphaproteobacteria bacterium]
MFAVIRSGGKQYKVAQGDVLRVEKLEGAAGDSVTLSDVLMIGGGDNAPSLGAGSVTAEVVRQLRDEKVIIFKKKRRHNYRRKKGHRQYLTEVKITGISA